MSSQQGRFSFDPDDPALPTSSGRFVVQHGKTVNLAQLNDWRFTDTHHSWNAPTRANVA